MRFVEPKVYLVGATKLDIDGLRAYLKGTGQEEFVKDVLSAKNSSISDAEILCSFYAKLCYSSLVPGRNKNIDKMRSVGANLCGCFDQGHGSVFEHSSLNFVATDVSRVLTHELVRHRVGTAFSQTSGRYVRNDDIAFVMDPILAPVEEDLKEILNTIEAGYNRMAGKLGLDEEKGRDRKKKLTSALRRILPDGRANEIGFSLNIRALRHIVQLRTSRLQAEWEIRSIFSQVYSLVKGVCPLVFYGARVEEIDGALEVTGMRMQPYERGADD
jgi:thymidylate synthase (FAD)